MTNYVRVRSTMTPRRMCRPNKSTRINNTFLVQWWCWSCCVYSLLIAPSMVALSPAPQFDWTVDTNGETSTTDVVSDVLTLPVVTLSTSTVQPFHPTASCPVDCVCKNSETVDCRGAGIKNVTNFLANHRVTKL